VVDAWLVGSTVDLSLTGIIFDGTSLFDGTHLYSPSDSTDSDSIALYGLFDVAFSYNLELSSDIRGFSQEIRAFVERFRAAGTQLRLLRLTAGELSDTVAPWSDTFSIGPNLGFSDSFAGALNTHLYDSASNFDGSIHYTSEGVIDDWLSTIALSTRITDSVGPSADAMSLAILPSQTYNSARLHNSVISYDSGVVRYE
jgi:hypothetical protein